MGLASAVLLTACASGTLSYQPDALYGEGLDGESLLRFSQKVSSANGTKGASSPTNLANFLQAGITLSDDLCDVWLDELSKNERDVNFARSITNLTGNALIGLGGINGASADSLARGALGLSAFNGYVDAYRAAIFQGVITDIRAKLDEGRTEFAAGILALTSATPALDNYDQAKRQLLTYHESCSPDAIAQLLKDGLENSRYAGSEDNLEQTIATAKKQLQRQRLHRVLYDGEEGEIDEDTLFKLYVLLEHPTSQLAAQLSAIDRIEGIKDDVIALDSEPEKTFKHELHQYALMAAFPARYQAAVKPAQAMANKVALQENVASLSDQRQVLIENRAKLPERYELTQELEAVTSIETLASDYLRCVDDARQEICSTLPLAEPTSAEESMGTQAQEIAQAQGRIVQSRIQRRDLENQLAEIQRIDARIAQLNAQIDAATQNMVDFRDVAEPATSTKVLSFPRLVPKSAAESSY